MWCMQFNILISLLEVLRALTWHLTWEMKRYNILVVSAANQTKFVPSVMVLGAICNNSTEVINSCQNQVWKAALSMSHIDEYNPGVAGWEFSKCGNFSVPVAPGELCMRCWQEGEQPMASQYETCYCTHRGQQNKIPPTLRLRMVLLKNIYCFSKFERM